MELTFSDESVGYQNGQHDMVLVAYLDGEMVGSLDYSVYLGIPHIKMLEVKKDFRRMGIGTKLLKQLQNMFPEEEIDLGMLTSDGTKLMQTIKRDFQENPSYRETKERYEDVRSEIQRIMAKIDRKDYSEANKLNDLHDEEYELEQLLSDMKTGKYFIKEDELISEAIFDLDDDVDYIFEKSGLREFFENFDKGLKPYEKEIYFRENTLIGFIDSNELKSEKAVAANSVNPIKIYCGFFPTSSNYNPFSKEIFITLNTEAFSMFYQDEVDQIHPMFRKTFYAQFKPTKIKSTIYHELSHWVRDSLHGKHIEKILSKVKKFSQKGFDNTKVNKIKSLGLPDVHMTNLEIDALVHNVKQYKRDIPKEEWDSMSFKDLIEEIPILIGIYNKIIKKWRNYRDNAIIKGDKNIKDEWQKDWIKLIVKRLDKEGLLGKNMKYFERKS